VGAKALHEHGTTKQFEGGGRVAALMETSNVRKILDVTGKLAIAVLGLALLIFFKSNTTKKFDAFLLVTIIAFYANLLLMAARCMPLYDRYMLAIMPFIFIGAARTIIIVYENIKIKFLKALAVILISVSALVPLNPTLDFGAFYSGNNGIEQAVNFMTDKKVCIIYGIGIGAWPLSYYFYNVCPYYAVAYAEMDKAKKFISTNESVAVYLLVNSEKADNTVIEKEFSYVPGSGFICGIKKMCDIYENGKIRYVIYEIIKSSEIKNGGLMGIK
jgi:hypothetical protein